MIEGDIATDLDAAKLSGRGAQVSLLNTSNGFGGECHLDAPMVNRALPGLDLPGLDLVIIENVGNLVCPAEFDVGEHAKAMVYSVTEGEDKPLKYPVMFRSVDVVLLNKIDLVPHLDVDVDTYIAHVREVNATATILPVSARTGAGMGAWFGWLRRFVAAPTLDSPAEMHLHHPGCLALLTGWPDSLILPYSALKSISDNWLCNIGLVAQGVGTVDNA